jgi:hypothetical protein
MEYVLQTQERDMKRPYQIIFVHTWFLIYLFQRSVRKPDRLYSRGCIWQNNGTFIIVRIDLYLKQTVKILIPIISKTAGTEWFYLTQIREKHIEFYRTESLQLHTIIIYLMVQRSEAKCLDVCACFFFSFPMPS